MNVWHPPSVCQLTQVLNVETLEDIEWKLYVNVDSSMKIDVIERAIFILTS